MAALVVAKVALDPLLGPLVSGIPGLSGAFSPKTLAAVAFLYLPVWAMRRRGEFPEDYGVTLAGWQRALPYVLVLCAVILPLYGLGFYLYAKLSHHLPSEISRLLTPYQPRTSVAFRLPRRFPLQIVDQLLVVALPEEFFYRGYMQPRLEKHFGGGRRALGIVVGKGFFLTQALFALGHLVEPYPWRLAVFFPALLFGWLRKRTGTIFAGVIFHAACNLTVAVLEASVLGIQ
jgi:uncharacterized protein